MKAIKSHRIADVRLAKLSVADVDRWLTRQRRAGRGLASLRNQRGALQAAVTQAQRWGWMASNPVVLSSGGRQKTAPRGSLSADDVRLVIEMATEYDPVAGLALRLAAVTGARRSELAALRWDDFDGRRVTIDISIAIVRHGTSSDRATPLLRDDATKTANKRTVTVDDGTARLLAALRAVREPYGPWILNVGDEPADPERITHWWARARDLGHDERRVMYRTAVDVGRLTGLQLRATQPQAPTARAPTPSSSSSWSPPRIARDLTYEIGGQEDREFSPAARVRDRAPSPNNVRSFRPNCPRTPGPRQWQLLGWKRETAGSRECRWSMHDTARDCLRALAVDAGVGRAN